MGLYDHLRISDEVIKVINQYTGCNQQLDDDYQTSVHDQLAHLYIHADLTVTDIPNGVYPVRHFSGGSLWFVVHEGSVSYWVYQYIIQRNSCLRVAGENPAKVIACKKVEHGVEWRTVFPDSQEHITLMTTIQKYWFNEPVAPVVPPMVEILSIVDLDTFGYIQVIMEERGICDYLIYKLTTQRDVDVDDIMFEASHLFGANGSLFNRLDWCGCNYTHDDMVQQIEKEKANGESYASKITPSGKWEQLLSAIERLHRSYTF